MLRILAVSTCLILAAQAGFGGKEDGFKIGDPAPDFKNLPGIDGKAWSLADFKQELLVICVTCNHCPVAAGYEERMMDFIKKYGMGKDAKVGFVAVAVSNLEEDKLEKMRIRAKEKGFNFPYLYDQSQKIAKQMDAHVTPEFYLFDKNRKLVYWGPMDDDLEVSKIKESYLVRAVDAVLAGKNVPTAQAKAFGCAIDYR